MSGDMLGPCWGSSGPIWRIWTGCLASPPHTALLTRSISRGFGAQPPTPWTANAYFTSILDDDKTLVLTAPHDDAGLHGFAIGRLVPAPPVYDPGGVSCVVDDNETANTE